MGKSRRLGHILTTDFSPLWETVEATKRAVGSGHIVSKAIDFILLQN